MPANIDVLLRPERSLVDLIETCRGLVARVLGAQHVALTLRDPVSLAPGVTHIGRLTTTLTPPRLRRFLSRRFHARDNDRGDPLSMDSLLRVPGHTRAYSGGPQSASPGDAHGIGLLRRMGVVDEARALLVDKGSVWGCLCIANRKQAFDLAAIGWLRSVAPTMAAALRLNFLRTGRMPSERGQASPGLVLLDPTGHILDANSEASVLLGTLPTTEEPMWVNELLANKADGRAPVTELMGPQGAVTAHLTTLRGQPVVIVRGAEARGYATRAMRAHGLTDRQREVVDGLCQGWDTRRIAFELDIADGTVKVHMRTVFDKMSVSSREELLAYLLV